MKKIILLLSVFFTVLFSKAQNINSAQEIISSGELSYEQIKPVTIEEDAVPVEHYKLAPSSPGHDHKHADNERTAEVSWGDGFICTLPDVHASSSTCCSYGIYDQAAVKTLSYRQPKHVFSTETAARNFAASVTASMPMFVPYRDSKVFPGQGWFYQNGGFHGAVDYGKSSDAYGEGIDPTFGIYAITDGKVTSVVWDDWLGNVVVIEHVAPNGKKYRTVYMHLRNGFDNDLAKAKAASTEGAEANSHPIKYNKFANLPNPSTLLWGTNAQKIKVKKGDVVKAGQLIAYSGNTGQGGAGNGLNNDGTPKNPNTANNHLHLMTVVPDPRAGYEQDWVQVDPYGVYSQVSNDDGSCYELLKDTPYVRLFAAFYPSFHNVPVEYVSKYFGYYPGMGIALQTLSLHKSGSKVLASGSFQYGLPSQWYARFYMTAANFQTYFNEYHNLGYRPREIQVTNDANGNARFSVIWKKRAGETYYTYFGMNDADWNTKWNKHVVQEKLVVAEHVSYREGGVNKHAAIFISHSNKSFAELHYMNNTTFDTKFNELHNAGYQLVSLDVAELGGTTYYGGVWRPFTSSYYAYYGMTAAGYQTKFNELSAQGYRLHRVQGYANSTKFAAIWVKNPVSNLREGEGDGELTSGLIEGNMVIEKNYLTVAPNPSINKSVVYFSVEQAERAKVVLRDKLGRQVALLADKTFETGNQQIEFSVSQFPADLYFIDYVSDSKRAAIKLMIKK